MKHYSSFLKLNNKSALITELEDLEDDSIEFAPPQIQKPVTRPFIRKNCYNFPLSVQCTNMLKSTISQNQRFRKEIHPMLPQRQKLWRTWTPYQDPYKNNTK